MADDVTAGSGRPGAPRRGVVVLTSGRSGSSMVGAMLEAMGCWMGDSFTRNPSYEPPRGLYEDGPFSVLVERICTGKTMGAGQDPVPELLASALTERYDRAPLWGLKVPKLVHLATDLREALLRQPFDCDARAVHLTRDPQATMGSMLRVTGWQQDQNAEAFLQDRMSAVEAAVAVFPGRVHPVAFEQLLDPETRMEQVVRLAAFVYGVQGVPFELATKAAQIIDHRLVTQWAPDTWRPDE